MIIKKVVMAKPSEYDREDFFEGSFGNRSMEIVASNIVGMMEETGDRWQPFSIEDYKSFCCNEGCLSDRDIYAINGMLDNGYLDEGANDKFQVNDWFLAKIKDFRVAPVQRESVRERRGRYFKEQKAKKVAEIADIRERGRYAALGAKLRKTKVDTFEQLEEIVREYEFNVWLVKTGREDRFHSIRFENKDHTIEIASSITLETAVKTAVNRLKADGPKIGLFAR